MKNMLRNFSSRLCCQYCL